MQVNSVKLLFEDSLVIHFQQLLEKKEWENSESTGNLFI